MIQCFLNDTRATCHDMLLTSYIYRMDERPLQSLKTYSTCSNSSRVVKTENNAKKETKVRQKYYTSLCRELAFEEFLNIQRRKSVDQCPNGRSAKYSRPGLISKSNSILVLNLDLMQAIRTLIQ